MGTWKTDRTSVKKYRARGRYKERAAIVKRRVARKRDKFAVSVRTNVPRGIFGFPEEYKTHLRYCDVYTLTSSSNAIARQVMRLNSLQDPDSTGVGHQPMYHDQFQSVYKRYTVLGSKMTVTFSPLPPLITTSQPSGPFIVGVVGDDDASQTSSVATAMENNSCKSGFLNSSFGGPNVKTLTLTYSPQRDLGLEPEDDTVGASFGSNPSKVWYGIAWAAESGLSTASSLNVRIEIDFYVKFSQLVDVGTS